MDWQLTPFAAQDHLGARPPMRPDAHAELQGIEAHFLRFARVWPSSWNTIGRPACRRRTGLTGCFESRDPTGRVFASARLKSLRDVKSGPFQIEDWSDIRLGGPLSKNAVEDQQATARDQKPRADRQARAELA